MASALQLKLSGHQTAQRSTENAINQHSKDITKNEKDLQTAKNELKTLDDSLRSSSIRRNVLNNEIKKIEEVLKTKRHDHSHATGQRQQHADNIRTTEAALLLQAKKPVVAKHQLKPQPFPLPIPADFLQTAKELQNDAHMHSWLENEKGYMKGEGVGIFHDKDGNTHKLTKNKGKYQIEQQR